MSEEEKQAIDWLKEELGDEKKSFKNRNYSYKGVTGLYGNNEVEIALKLIDKQQKEIERLKKFEKYYENGKVVWQRKDYVSKDKIRELKEKVEKEMISNPYDFSYMINELLGE